MKSSLKLFKLQSLFLENPTWRRAKRRKARTQRRWARGGGEADGGYVVVVVVSQVSGPLPLCEQDDNVSLFLHSFQDPAYASRTLRTPEQGMKFYVSTLGTKTQLVEFPFVNFV